MSAKTLTDIRATFLSYFQRQGHTVVESSPLVPRNDPTLMFTNSGMVQFKNVFTGLETRPYKRATTAQKSVRAGGKHNDLENVGYTARHHTFFEMLGNFSFGDYFKEDAIRFAWELVTRDFGLAKDRLLVTVYSEDEEAADFWKKIAGLDDGRIIRIPTSDNFWAMGDTGPCGPCSEIFYDHGPAVKGGPPGSADADGDRFIEIWNLVFMQYEQIAPGKREKLPKPSIDTGMGLERFAAILQGVHSNFQTDLFRALTAASAEMTGVSDQGPQKSSHYVIADHLRASAFLIADGVLPLNEGRGYVLRRIMRRGMRHAHILGAKEPLLHRLVPVLLREMGAAYPELLRAEGLITETLRQEETRFRHTLDRGLKLLDDELSRLPSGQMLAGEVAFKLYDTYGFPFDLTQDILRGKGLKADAAAYDAAMNKQKEAARAAWAGSGEKGQEKIWFELRDELGATEFLGYATEKAEGEVRAIVQKGARVTELKAGEEGWILLNQTPFYGESGGQVGDTGRITTAKASLAVLDTQKPVADLFAHKVRVEKGAFTVGEAAILAVDAARRSNLRANHSATHLLHAALRRKLGTHVGQKGSLVAPDRLRFDISHPAAIQRDDLAVIEQAVNDRIRANEPAETRLLPLDDAIALGAMAMFGEKYGAEVRVISMGGASAGDGKPYSLELCGGTHVQRTGDIGLFKIIAESAVSAGVRRIEAVAGAAAEHYLAEQEKILKDTAATLNAAPAELPARIASLLEERKKMEREIADLRRKLASGGSAGSANEKIVAGIKLMTQLVEELPAGELKAFADGLKKKLGSGIVAVVGVHEGKASLVVGVTPDLAGKISAVELVRFGAEALGGKGGGGRPDLAQAGGPETTAAPKAFVAIEEAIGRLAA